MEVNDFISALLNCIPPKNFKIVRYYGIYSRRSKTELRDLLDQLVSWYGNLSIYNYTHPLNGSKKDKVQKVIICPLCGNKMKLVEIYNPNDHG